MNHPQRPELNHLGTLLKIARTERGMSQKDIDEGSKALGNRVAVFKLGRHERGEHYLSSMDLFTVSKVLGVPIESLYPSVDNMASLDLAASRMLKNGMTRQGLATILYETAAHIGIAP